MAFAEQDKVFVNFTEGFNTEATPLNFPENAAQEIDNVDLFVTGEVKRRLGIDFEENFTVRPETTSAGNTQSYALSNFPWESVGGSSEINFLVVQIGLKLFFHNLGEEPVSDTLVGTLDLNAFKTGGSAETRVLSTAFTEGFLVVANQDIDPVLIEFDQESNTFSAEKIILKIRDFDGIEENVEPDFRPTTLTPAHKYNLANQGWPSKATVNNVPRGSRGVQRNIDPVAYTRQKIGVFPSNADLFFASKAASAQDAEVLGTYSPWALEHNVFGNTPAPKGHFILDLFNQTRGSIPSATKSTIKRPKTVGAYAGRVWYAGVPDSDYTGEIYFSQILTDKSNVGKCYQEHDPTAEDLNALLATDGGVINIGGLGDVFAMVELGADLIVVSNTGVWAISGTDNTGNFSADGHTIRKISSDGANARESVVEVEGALMWWSESGIWLMSPSEITSDWQVQRITKDTIQTFYDSLGIVNKTFARGFHDTFNKKVVWLFNDDVNLDGINNRFKYNRALVLDTTLGAFYTYTISDLDANSPFVVALSLKSAGNEAIVTYNVVQGVDNVVEGADNIVQDIAFEQFAEVKIKLLTFVPNVDGTFSYTFSEFNNRSFTDWQTQDQIANDISNNGADYTSVIQAGWNTFGDLLRDKTITHLTSFFNRTEDGFAETDEDGVVQFTNPSGARVQVRWEFTDDNIGRWTSAMQAYRLRQSYIPEDDADPFTYGYTVVSSKLRMRGRGKAFSVRYTSEAGKDMQLLGFAVNVRAGAKL